MIRLLIAVIGLFLIWVLFLSSFTKQRKILITVIALLMTVIGVWLESNTGVPRANIVSTDDISSCGVIAKHSYRSNFDLDICIRNNASDGQVKRLTLLIVAEKCSSSDNCLILEQVQRDASVNIAPNSDARLSQNLSFDKVDPAAAEVIWSVEIVSVKAVR